MYQLLATQSCPCLSLKEPKSWLQRPIIFFLQHGNSKEVEMTTPLNRERSASNFARGAPDWAPCPMEEPKESKTEPKKPRAWSEVVAPWAKKSDEAEMGWRWMGVGGSSFRIRNGTQHGAFRFWFPLPEKQGYPRKRHAVCQNWNFDSQHGCFPPKGTLKWQMGRGADHYPCEADFANPYDVKWMTKRDLKWILGSYLETYQAHSITSTV